jgi:hypothetical protein
VAIILKACVNKSGSSVNVYSDMSLTVQSGQIYNNEVFVLYGDEGSTASISFVNPSGNFVGGFINNSLPNGFATFITDYPIRMMNGYYIFKLRRSANVKNPSGANVATLASGTEVACNSATVGQTYSGYKHIVGVVNGSGINVSYNGYFVDMGFGYGSSGSTMTLYGTY